MQNFIKNEGYNNLNNLFSSGKGSDIFINNKKFLDLSLCAGSILLGHNSNIYKKTIKEILNKKLSNFAAKNIHAVELSKTLHKIFPKYKKFIFCNSGTEAVMKSLRVARAISKKKLIISVTGSWHGSTSELLYTNNNKLKNIELSSGLDINFKNNLKFIPYNNIDESEKILKKYKKNIMCIIIEPIQGCLPIEAKKYLQFLSDYCKKNNLTLIFDEMITGLRFNCSSAQDQLNLNPSISTFGKCFGGGFPIGIIGLKKEVLIKLKKKRKKIFFGGTFSANSINSYLSNKIVNYILKNKKKIFPDLEKKAFYLEKKINEFLVLNNFDARCLRVSSMLRIVFTKKEILNRSQRDFLEKKNLKKINFFRNFLFKNKIYYSSSGIIFLATTTSYKNLDYFIKIVKKAFKKIY